MTEKVLYHYSNGFAGTAGDASAPYTEDEFYNYNHALWASDKADGGILYGIGNQLEPAVNAGPPDSVDVNTGRAQIHGMSYFNTANVNLPLPFTPAIGDTGGIIYIRDNFTGANNPPLQYQARLQIAMSADNNPAIPTLIQSAGTTYDIPICSFIVDVAGTIWTDTSKTTAGVTDLRHYIIHAGSGMIKLREFDGDGVTASFTWSGIQQDLSHLLIVGNGRNNVALAEVVVGLKMNGIGAGYASSAYKRTGLGVATEVATGGSFVLGMITGTAGAANAFDSFEARINNYTQATGFHSCRSTGLLYSAGGGGTYARVDGIGWYTGAAQAITSLSIAGVTLAIGSKVTLYGLK